ncbi:MAG: 2,3-bisphosphoglycerate-independent phosphoglycerate mutase [Patescibacteria group bacterium]
MKIERPFVLIIMDGWGVGENDEHNPIYLAPTPNIDHLMGTYAHTLIGAAGEHIGLTPGHQGSSEIGHLIIGAGQNVVLPQTQIRMANQSGEVKHNRAYLDALDHCKRAGSRLHIMGLLSDKGVHGYDESCHVLLELAKKQGIPDERIFVHIFSDGRDVPPKSVQKYVERLRKIGVGNIASIQGRYWAMDRDHRWERVQKAYDMLVHGKAVRTAKTIDEAINTAYEQDETDEFIKPTLIIKDSHFKDDDVVLNFNFRVDREIEMTQALIEPGFKDFNRGERPMVYYVAMTDYYEGISCPVAFKRKLPKNTLGEMLSKNHLTQFRCAETEKWVYLTKIFNGLQEDPFPGEVRELIPSDKVATYDLKPEMKAMEIAKAVANHIHQKSFDVYFINFANPDMLGHTGNKKAIMKGISVVDTAVGLIYQELLNMNGQAIISADHGDAEIVWDKESQQPHTFHTDNLVPFIYVDEQDKNATLREAGSLRDIAPSMLKLLHIDKPDDMTGTSIIV